MRNNQQQLVGYMEVNRLLWQEVLLILLMHLNSSHQQSQLPSQDLLQTATLALLTCQKFPCKALKDQLSQLQYQASQPRLTTL